MISTSEHATAIRTLNMLPEQFSVSEA